MKKGIAVLTAAGLLLAGAGSATAAAPVAKQIASLQKQMNTLKKQNATLTKRVAKLQKDQKEISNIAAGAFLASGCLIAVTADAFAGTWSVINQVAARTVVPATQPLNDQSLCSTLRVLRQPTTVPPTMTPFSSLLTVLTGSFLPRWLLP